MIQFIRRLFYRHQKSVATIWGIKAGFKVLVTITVLTFVAHIADEPFLIAPLGASCMLVFITPESKYAQPVNIIGGYFIALLVGIIFNQMIPGQWWATGVALAITIFTMSILRVSHPPAGATTLIIFPTQQHIGFEFIPPAMLGSVLLVLCAIILHKIPPQRPYPKKIKE